MKPCWRDWGLTREGVEKAEKVLPRMMELFAETEDFWLMSVVLKEANFRHFELPRRTPEFQEKYKEENG
jgi:hypothetical protein